MTVSKSNIEVTKYTEAAMYFPDLPAKYSNLDLLEIGLL